MSEQNNQTAVIALILTPVEAEKAYFALGKLPAEAVEELRTKIKGQVGDQRNLIFNFCRQPEVQTLIAEVAATPDAISETVN
ncbi:MAG TPA: hypothetical protein PLD20_05850 [Blastocatellia bacterium]|nr:hypothetical protein [Blastocatellia bacterium]HMV87602.1 hypothetical protein [Blastocatellia bacterium]HMX24708.1 hypothetical protein [Blastocatellia bacterium]HMY73357.1 hypothetical protein [Blastocatellia bacterium]HMZ17431.1 hypothetical protein [Blastocatellia bacterium]